MCEKFIGTRAREKMKNYQKVMVTILCLSLTLSTTLAAFAKTINIVPIGDSITQGGRSDRAEYSYRYPLFYKLKNAKYDVDFLGSMNQGLNADFKWPAKNGVAFDVDHEGHYGWKTAAVRDNLAEWSKKWRGVPDIALIHLGTNDQDSKDFNADIIAPMKDMIKLLRAKNPRVVVLFAHLDFNGGNALKIRPLVEAMAKEMNTKKSPVRTVAMYEGWVENPEAANSDTFDWAHPNLRGQEKMASKWFAAMQTFLPKTPVAKGAKTKTTK